MKFLISAIYNPATGEMISGEYADIPIEPVVELIHRHMQEIAEQTPS